MVSGQRKREVGGGGGRVIQMCMGKSGGGPT